MNSWFENLYHSSTKSDTFWPIESITAQACSHGIPVICQVIQVQVLLMMLIFKNAFPIKKKKSKNTIQKGTNRQYLTFNNIYLYFVFYLQANGSFQFIDSALCLTSMLPNFIICSIRKLQIE